MKLFEQQRKVYNLYRYRRSKGDPCDHDWFGSTMTRICKEDKPEGYDPEKKQIWRLLEDQVLQALEDQRSKKDE